MNTVVNLAKELITIPSVKGNEEALQKVLHTAVSKVNKFEVVLFEQNGSHSALVSNGKTSNKKFKIILNAHLDVVPAKEEQFSPYEKGGKIYGRGAIDMKSSAAVEILAFKEVADKINYPLGLQLVTDEEIGGFNGTRYQINKGVRADFVVAGEHTNFGVNNKAKGILWVKFRTAGKAAHAAYPWNGQNAVIQMMPVMEHIQKTFPTPEKESWVTTANIAVLDTANKTFNKVPDVCELSVDIRYVPEDTDTVEKKLLSGISKNVAYEIIEKEPAQITDGNNEYVKKLRQSVYKVSGKESPIIVKHGGSDIRHYNDVGCAGVTFGPLGAGLHTDEEWVDIDSLGTYYQILVDFLLSLNT